MVRGSRLRAWALVVSLCAACGAPGQDSEAATDAEVELDRLSRALQQPSCEAAEVVWENPLSDRKAPCETLRVGDDRWIGRAPFGEDAPEALRNFCVFRFDPAPSKVSPVIAVKPLKPLKPVKPVTILRPVPVPLRPVLPQPVTPAPKTPVGKQPGAKAPQRTPDSEDLGRLHAVLRKRYGDNAPVPELDCANVAPMSTPGQQALRDKARKQLWTMAGRIAQPVDTEVLTRVAIIDTAAQPYTSLVDDTYGHGRLMGRIVEDLTCGDDGTCASEIRNYLAMPLLDVHTQDTVYGGYFGTRTQLAVALWRAIEDWTRDLATAGGPPHLVLSMSLGWDPDWLGGVGFDQGSMPVASRLVHAVLSRARCLGVASVAAAGNLSDSSSYGPTVVGAWESLPAPEQCAPYLGARHDYSALKWQNLERSKEDYTPLVYAVEGVDQYDRALANARDGATPRMVAYGLSAVTHDTRHPHTATLVGTSIAAAVVSAAAAYVWAVEPGQPVHKVLDTVYRSGVPLYGDSAPLEPDFCLETHGPCSQYEVTRTSVCASVSTAICGAPGCPGAPACKTIPQGHGASLIALDAADFANAGVVSSYAASACTGSTCASDLAQPDFCYSPWVVPQPGSEGCAGVCAYSTLTRTAYIWLHHGLAGSARYITLSDGTSYALPSGASKYSVTLPGTGVANSATLSVVHGSGAGGYTTNEPLWLY